MRGAGFDFRPVQELKDDTHSVGVRIPYLEVGNSISDRIVERLDLELHTVALLGINGVLFLGNVVFLNEPTVTYLEWTAGNKPTIQISGADKNWQLRACGINTDGSSIETECLLTRQVAQMKICGRRLELRISR